MKLAAGILCWNHIDNDRTHLFEQSLKSVREANPDVLIVADNGSTDGTANLIGDLPEGVLFPKIDGFPHGNTCGYGMNKLAGSLLVTEPDIIVLSNDDIVWQPDAFDRLRKVWDEVPDDVTIISGLVEPTFALPNKRPWNDPMGVADVAGEQLLFRRSVPGGAWSFRASDFHLIFPVSVKKGIDDVPACHQLVDSGRGVAAIDLAEHAGIGQSTWGNASHDYYKVEDVEDIWRRYE